MQLGVPFSPEQASTNAPAVDGLYAFLWSLTIVFGVLLTTLILYFAVKYRRRDEDEIPRPVAGSHRLEAVWIVIPFVLAMGIFVWSAQIYYRMYRPPDEAIDVYVVAKQWMWKFQHLDGHREINELHVPVGRKVKLTMTTEDVIHSFYVPAFRIKMDVVPGKYSTMWFEPTKAGRYHLFCAEYCGTSHSAMIGWIDVMEAPEYQAWLSGGAGEGSLATTGEKLFQQFACITCHKSDGTGRGPSLENVFGKQVQLSDGQRVVADEAYVRESITNPRAKVVAGYQPIMPTFQGQISEEQLLELVAYVRSLAAKAQTSGQGTGGLTTGANPPAARPQPARPPAQTRQQ
jgi:cytochrome c oxidase subunit 2